MFVSRPAEVRVFGLLRAQHLQACGLAAWLPYLGVGNEHSKEDMGRVCRSPCLRVFARVVTRSQDVFPW